MNGRFSGVLILFFFFLCPHLWADTCWTDTDEAAFWLALPGADSETVESLFGDEFIELPPAALDSTAERIIWYEKGLTFWFDSNGLSMARADASAGGRISFLHGGMKAGELTEIFGEPWIESGGSLYYNLPWNGGPVRLRFAFHDSGLQEIYLYKVR